MLIGEFTFFCASASTNIGRFFTFLISDHTGTLFSVNV